MKKKTYLIALFFAVAFIACNDTEEPVELTAEEASTEITNMADDLSGDIVSMVESEGIAALTDLSSMVSPIATDPATFRKKDPGMIRKVMKERAQAFKQTFLPSALTARVAEDERFVFADHYGVYTWNFEFETWDYTSGGIEYIEINFPTEGSTENDALFKLLEYEDTEITDEFEAYYQPTRILANLAVDGSEKAAIDMTAAYREDGTPSEASVSLDLVPFSYSLEYDDASATSSTLDVSISRDGEVLMAAGVSVDFAGMAKMLVNTATAYWEYGVYRIDGSVDAAAARQAEDVENADPNDYFTSTISKNDQHLGDIVLVMEEGEWVPYVEFKDGTTKKLETLMQPAIDRLEAWLEDFAGEENLG